MWSEASHFALWLERQPQPGLLPNQVKSVVHAMDRLEPADLIVVMYYAEGKQALDALTLLIKEFQIERMIGDGENEHAAHSWN
jgi:hypothetical protein